MTSSRLKRVLDEHGIEVHNIWNIDKKGFMLGRVYKAHVICTRTRRNLRLVQNGERKFVTVLEGISAAGALLLPLVLDKETAHWMDWRAYVTDDEPAYFAYSAKGWTDGRLGVGCLVQVLNQEPQQCKTPGIHKRPSLPSQCQRGGLSPYP